MSIDENLRSRDTYGWTEGVPPSCNVLTDPVLSILRELKPRSVLDAGCGNGALALAMQHAGYDVVGVDGDAAGIEIARRFGSGVRFEVGQFHQAPPGQFDAVVSTEVVEHLYAPHELASYAFAALRPGGHLVISTPYHGYLKNLALSLLNGWDNHFTVQWCGGHIKFWSRKTLTDLLKNAGFVVRDFRGVGRMPYLWMSMVLIAQRPSEG